MILVVGLGNPGKEFQKTRHNIGFRIVDELQKENNFPDFKISKKFNAEISEGVLDDEKILLVKPQTFMNNSGKAIKKLFAVHRSLLTELVIIHDEADLPLGKIRIVKNRGAAGHKGIESIIKETGTKDFIRFRIGTSPLSQNLKPKILNRFVLRKFNKEEEEILKEVIKKAAGAIGFLVNQGLERTMTSYNC